MDSGVQTDVRAKNDAGLRLPKMYTVIMHNDDITTMDFVVDVLIKIFKKSSVDASCVMMDIHNNGSGIAGVYTFDIAVTKKLQTERIARDHGFPLRLTLNEAAE